MAAMIPFGLAIQPLMLKWQLKSRSPAKHTKGKLAGKFFAWMRISWFTSNIESFPAVRAEGITLGAELNRAG